MKSFFSLSFKIIVINFLCLSAQSAATCQGLSVQVKNVPVGNVQVPGHEAIVTLWGRDYIRQANTSYGTALIQDMPPVGTYSLKVQVRSASGAYENALEYWGSEEIVQIGRERELSLEFTRKMPFIEGLWAFDGERFAQSSSLEAGHSLLRASIANPGNADLDLNLIIKLKSPDADTIITLIQPLKALAGKSTIVDVDYYAGINGFWYSAPALELPETGQFTDCWDWSPHPLFSVIDKHRYIDFSGYRFKVKQGYSPPGPNLWSADEQHLKVTKNGSLKLSLTPSEKGWLATEVISEDFFGFGTYTFYLESDPMVYHADMVAAIFLYRDEDNEIDLEFTRWGRKDNLNPGNYVVQPYSVQGNQYVFAVNLNGNFTTHRIIWNTESIIFQSWHGHDPIPEPHLRIALWEYTGNNIPSEEKVRLHFNFWLFRGAQPANAVGQEFIISRFTYNR
jgi:hypothetical protein